MQIIDNLSIVGSSEYLNTDEFCIYAAKNPFWADQRTNELVCKVSGRNAIAVNMVDADDSRYFHPKIFKFLIRIIHDKIKSGKSVTIVCNKGRSRSASIALLYLAVTGEISNSSYKSARFDFLAYYPDYSPNRGISIFLEKTWKNYFNR